MLSARWLAAVLFLCATSISAQPPKDRTVVVISIDGLPAYSFDDFRLPAPTLRRLAREGAIAKGMRPVNPTVTWPNHTSMVTGVPPAVHGVLFNGMLVRQGVTVPPKNRALARQSRNGARPHGL